MEIRLETRHDRKAIRGVVADAFGRQDEARLVDDLRAAGDLAISLVAASDGKVRGHVALSRLMSPPRALALAPVSVSPPVQGRGIGSDLIREALARAKEGGTAIVFIVGAPDYYSRFGFSAAAAEPFACRYAGPYFLARRLGDARVTPERVIYTKAFDGLES